MKNNKHEDYKLIYSPRTSLNNEKLTEEKLYNELSKSFDPYTVKILKRHFKEHLGVLDRDLFIGILKEHLLTWYPDLPNREDVLIRLLIRLFNEIDLDSDHYLTWDEFSNYIIHVTNSKKIEYSVYNLQQYLLSKDSFEFLDNKNKRYMENKNDNDYISNVINYCFYINKLKSIGLCHEGSNKIIFYNIITLKKFGFFIDLLLTQNEIDKYEINELEQKTEERLREQEEKIEKLLIKKKDVIKMRNEIRKSSISNKNEKITTNSVEKEKDNYEPIKLQKRVMHIINTCFVDDYDVLFISTTNNKISAWKFDNKFNCFNNINVITSNESEFIFQKEEIKIPIFSTELPQYTMCFDSSTNHLYTGQKDGKILKWEMTSLKPVDILDIEKDKQIIAKNQINLPNINKFQKTLETNSNINDENNNELNKKNILIQDKKRESVSCLLLLKGLRLLCSAYFTGNLILWDTITKKPKKIFNDQKTGIYHVIFDSKKNYLYTCGFEHDIFVYDPYSNANAAYKLKGHNGSVNSISLNSNLNELVSIDILGTIKIWDTNKFVCFQTININEKILLEQNNVKREDQLFELFSSNKKKNLTSNIYIQALPFVNKILVYGDRLILYEKGETSNPLLTDSCMILGCIYNKILNNIITFSSKSVKFWNIFNGKLEKVYNDLVIISEITSYAVDDEFKRFYLGDSGGKIKSFYLSSGEFLKEFESHKDEISFIFSLRKYNFLITSSKDLCIKIHKLNDLNNNNSVLNEFYPCREDGSPFQDKNLLNNISVNKEKGLLLISLTNGWIVDYNLENFRFLLNLNPNYSESIRNSIISNVLDIKEFGIILVTLENGEKYFLLNEYNKFFDQYNIYKFGNFLEDNNNFNQENNKNNDNNKKNIVICSVYCHEEYKLFTGDHFGFISCYDLSVFKNLFSQNYNKNEIFNILKNININLIYRKQTHKESVTSIDIPFGLKPKILLSISTDRTVHLINYYTGEYIDALRVISIKYEAFPVAIKYYKKNPFVSKDNTLIDKEKYKEEKEEEKQINNYIKKYYENKLTKEDKKPENVLYRYFLEQNKKPIKPKISYDNDKDNNDIDAVSYAYDLINYEIKTKFNNTILYGQKLFPYCSTAWKYNLDVSNLIKDGNTDLEKIKKKIKNVENEIRESEKYFEKISINDKNYLPKYMKNLKQEDKEQINEIIFNKINTFNLAVTRKNTIKNEIQSILLKSEKKKNPNISIMISNEQNNFQKNNIYTENNLKSANEKKFNYNKLPVLKNKKSIKSIEVIKKNNKNYFSEKKRKEDKNKLTISQNENQKNLKVNKYNKILERNKYRVINLSKDYNDKRFLGFKNEFNEKYNEFKIPFDLLLKRNKNDTKLVNKLSFNNNNNITKEE